MNTRWLRQNTLLVGFIAAFLIVLAVVGWLLWGQYDIWQATQTELTDKLSRLEQLQNNDPSLTEDNVAIAGENEKRLQETQQQLQQKIGRVKIPLSTITNNIEFTKHLRGTINHLEAKTTAAKISIPKDFKFGFRLYATVAPRNNQERLERLAIQVSVVQKLTELMIENKVEQIESIRRVAIEPSTVIAGDDDILADSISIHLQEHYEAMPFELQFLCSADALQKLLNQIAAADKFFFVTRLVTIEQEAIQKKPETTDVTPGADTGTMETAPVIVTPDRPPRLRVKARLDFIEILPPNKRPPARNR
jgi:hypothetical protein